MLLNLREYHRPKGVTPDAKLADALRLIARPEIRTVPLAGGDALLGSADREVEAVVDLQGLGLDTLTYDDRTGVVRIGAMLTRSALADALLMQEHGCGLLAQAARQWRGNVQRNRDTVGGAVVLAAPEDPLIAALLVFDAKVTLHSSRDHRALPLHEFLADRRAILAGPALITEVAVPISETRSGSAIARVGRTPADQPIVLAIARVRTADGRCAAARLALGGVAETPILAQIVESRLVNMELSSADISDIVANVAGDISRSVDPKGDERGSTAYRRAMAGVLSRRALMEAWSLC